MSHNPHAFRPASLELEPRALLSATSPGLRATVKPLLSETVQGRYQTAPEHRATNAPVQIKLNGSGTSNSVSKLAGNLRVGGRRAANTPNVTGTMTLSDAQGSLKLQLSGTGGSNFAPSSRLAVNAGVVKGTGAYRNVQAVGPAVLSFEPGRTGGTTTGNVRVALDLVQPVR